MVEKILQFTFKSDSLADKETRNRIAIFSSWLGIVINILLGATKITIGILSGSISVLVDGVNNTIDITTSVISLVGYKITNRPPDKKHPLGYGRVEYITSFIVSICIFMIGIEFLKSAISAILDPKPLVFTYIFLILMLISVPIKLLLYFYYNGVSRCIESQVFKSVAIDALSDVFTSLIVCIPLVFGNTVSFPLDGWVALAVSLYILYTTIKSMKEAISLLIGTQADPELLNTVLKDLYKVEYILNIHDVQAHHYGVGQTIITMDIEISGEQDFVAIHNKLEIIRKKIETEKKIKLVLHMDPIVKKSPQEKKIHEELIQILDTKPEYKNIHDFFITNNTVYMDIELFIDSPNNLETIKKEIEEEIKLIDPKLEWKVEFIERFK